VGLDGEQIEALLAGVPDLRPALSSMRNGEIAEMLELVGVGARYNH
jgi:hypothetical protein